MGLRRSPWRVLWAIQSRTSWHVITGSPFRRARANQDKGNRHNFSLFFLPSQLSAARLLSRSSSISQAPYSVAATIYTTAVAHHALPLVPAADGASVSVLVFATFPVSSFDTRNKESRTKYQERAKQLTLRREAGRHKPKLVREIDDKRAATVHATTTAAVRQP